MKFVLLISPGRSTRNFESKNVLLKLLMRTSPESVSFGVSCFIQENVLETLVIDEWRGVSGNGTSVECDVTGGICPWVVLDAVNGSDANISSAAAVLMVRFIRILTSFCTRQV